MFENIHYRWYVELLVHPEVLADKIGFGGLSPKILFYKSVSSFKTFYDIVIAVFESKDPKIYF